MEKPGFRTQKRGAETMLESGSQPFAGPWDRQSFTYDFRYRRNLMESSGAIFYRYPDHVQDRFVPDA